MNEIAHQEEIIMTIYDNSVYEDNSEWEGN